VACQAGRTAEPAPVRVPADGDREAWQPAVRFDPLIHSVAITGHCVIGDQIRVPAAWCAVAGCEAAFADPAALGEADNRARAAAAGWATDALGRLACPACQCDHPVPAWWVPLENPVPPVTAGQPAVPHGRPAVRTNPYGRRFGGHPPRPRAGITGRSGRACFPRWQSAVTGGLPARGRGFLTRAQCRARPGPLLPAVGKLRMLLDLLDVAPGHAEQE
jgi:hypothetical protein